MDQGWESFTAEDHAVWDLLFERQVELLGSRVGGFLLVFMIDGRRGLRDSWPAALVAGGVFAVVQFATSNFIGKIKLQAHFLPGL